MPPDTRARAHDHQKPAHRIPLTNERSLHAQMVTRTREQQQTEMAQTVDGIKKLTNAKLEAERSLRERRVMAGQCWSLSWAMQHRTAAASAEGGAHAGILDTVMSPSVSRCYVYQISIKKKKKNQTFCPIRKI